MAATAREIANQQRIPSAHHLEILRRAQAGERGASIAKDYGVSRQRVAKILNLAGYRRQKSKGKIKARAKCIVHPARDVGYRRNRFCSAKCAEGYAHALRRLRDLTVYREAHLNAQARYEGYRRARPRKGQVLHKKSQTYKLLSKYGLLERLPKRIKIV